jgi:hypothetical protein
MRNGSDVCRNLTADHGEADAQANGGTISVDGVNSGDNEGDTIIVGN